MSALDAASDEDWSEEEEQPPPFLVEGMFVKLISNDDHEFIVSKESVIASGTIRTMLTGPGLWKETAGPIPTIRFPEIDTKTLEKIIQYFQYKKRFENTPGPHPLFPIDSETVIGLSMAANYLDC